MTWLTKLSLRQKLLLISLVPTLAALSIVFVCNSVMNRNVYREVLEANLSGTAEILAYNSTTSLTLNDKLAGIRLLESAAKNEDIDYVCLFDEHGSIFSVYSPAEKPFRNPPESPRPAGTYFESDGVHVYFPIQSEGRLLGTLYLHANQDGHATLVRRANLTIVVVLTVSGLIALILALRIRSLIYQPISQLALAAHTISQTDDYSLRVVKQGDDELGELVDQFNRMVKRIQEQNAALKREILVRHATEQQFTAANEELMFEIGQRSQVEEQLGVLLEDLEKKNVELNEFAYVVSHDLKAPLRGISSLASWLIKDYSDALDEKGLKYLDQLKLRTRRMHTFIEGILQYSRLGQVPMDKHLVDSQRVVYQVIETLHPNEDITIEIPEPLPMIYYDKLLIYQVFQNLIENALQHMESPEGTITITCVQQEKYWQYAVADNGVGIPDRHHERIFRIFQSLKPRDDSDSSGIGLSLVKRIVERNGGRIHVQSKEGEGTTFLFTVPIQSVGVDSLHGMDICILDSNEDYARHTAKLLESLAIQITTISTWTHGVAQLAEKNRIPDIFLIDPTNMSDDVDVVLGEITTRFPSAHLIACVPDSKTGEFDNATDLRFSGVITKPFTVDKMNAVLNMSYLDV